VDCECDIQTDGRTDRENGLAIAQTLRALKTTRVLTGGILPVIKSSNSSYHAVFVTDSEVDDQQDISRFCFVHSHTATSM